MKGEDPGLSTVPQQLRRLRRGTGLCLFRVENTKMRITTLKFTSSIQVVDEVAELSEVFWFITGWWCNNHLEKYESQWEGWHPIYEMEHNPAMFETTNQIRYTYPKPYMFSGLGSQAVWEPSPGCTSEDHALFIHWGWDRNDLCLISTKFGSMN